MRTRAAYRPALCWGLLLLLIAPAAAAQTAGAQADRGSTVIGDEEEAAIGLFLRPWREEAVSDIDRPPRHHDMRPEALRIEDVPARVHQYERLRAFQRTQPQRR
ncbi:hypothetical protein [Algiphilus sp.]|uniref:hypothetical protein n=1 Tax=Algiphilus sp. TaxID=1872431 RepID=UPI003B52E1D5